MGEVDDDQDPNLIPELSGYGNALLKSSTNSSN
jgi:hypothetical protein